WFNEMHAKNTSQKVRAVLKNKGESGISLAHNVPYGYKKDENDKRKWLVDETSAEVVKEIKTCNPKTRNKNRWRNSYHETGWNACHDPCWRTWEQASRAH
ncbi:MAG: hypothetical protein II640_02335, partial [Lachnospiraceae bacterium]|nr:hypothetical protein [Lachnospiraceae bacterium]